MTQHAKSEVATPREVAEFLHQTEGSLAQDRYRGIGPRFIKHGRRVLYRWADVYAYLEANTVQRTDDPRGVGA
ncbi:hypothetical protein MycrhDRAFT_4255 [Mycolicibacterium rhodesiae JS60]|nr:hypothetical protein MycrhDRAFT_4255 [Mycolicibacterium rhodesiae JS60]